MQLRETPEEAAGDASRCGISFARASPKPSPATSSALSHDPRTDPASVCWREAIAGRDWMATAWPQEHGGAGMSVVNVNQEFAETDAPSPAASAL